MPTFSQIAAAGSSPGVNDRLLGCTSGNADVLYLYSQVAATTPNTQTGLSYTLALTDFDGTVEMNNASANTLTIPLNATVAFPVGTVITVIQFGTGQTTIVAAAGVTTRAPSGLILPGQFQFAEIYQRAVNDWYVWVS